MDQIEISTLLDTFSRSVSLSDRSAAITRLMEAKVLTRHSEDPRFEEGLTYLQDVAANSEVPLDRLLAISELVRISRVAKRLQKDLGMRLTPAFHKPLSPSKALTNAEARYYLAKAFASARSPWVIDYLASGVAEEETAEKVRLTFLEALFLRVGSLSELFKLLSEALGRTVYGTEKPGDSMGRRVTRILAATRTMIIKSNLLPGDDLGVAFGKLIRIPLAKYGMPESGTVRIALAKECVLAIHDVVRTRFSVSSEPETYGALRYSREFFPGYTWSKELRSSLKLLEGDITESILLLGKQGICDDNLIDVLELVCGSREQTRSVTRNLADLHQELPEQVRFWLRTGRFDQQTKVSDALQESSLLEADPLLADLMLNVEQVRELLTVVKTDVESALEVFDPKLHQVLTKFGDRFNDVLHQIENLAHKRGLMLLGQVGASVEYLPKYFAIASSNPTRTVKIIRPAVVRRTSDGSPGGVVIKGLAE